MQITITREEQKLANSLKVGESFGRQPTHSDRQIARMVELGLYNDNADEPTDYAADIAYGRADIIVTN